jgi:hypothetical protein
MDKRKYEKIQINLNEFKKDTTSGKFTPKEIAVKYNLIRNNSVRRVYYIAFKHNIIVDFKKDNLYITEEYKQKIANKLKGKKRTLDQIENYKKAAKLRGNNRKIGSYQHKEETKHKIKESNKKTYEQLPIKWKKNCIDNPGWFKKLRKIDYNKLNEWQKYVYDVRLLSQRNARKYCNLIEGEKLIGYHLDHIVSISDAFNNNLPKEITASYHNLRYIPAKENLKKNHRSSLTIEELKNRYYER